MKNISKAVSKLTPQELAQAAYLYQKILSEQKFNKQIPKPSLGTISKHASPRRFIYQTTRHESAGITYIYLDTLNNKHLEKIFYNHPVTGRISLTKRYV